MILKTLLQRSWKFLLVIGVIAVAINLAFGRSNTMMYVEELEYNVIHIYKYNLQNYLLNIQTNLSNVVNLSIKRPERNWNSDIINDLALILDYILYGLNLFMWPLRLGAYIVRFLFTILGVNMNGLDPNNAFNWLARLINTFINNLQFNYV